MPQINVLHLMNDFQDSSISRIILRLARFLGREEYCWHVGALSNSGDMQAKFVRLGAQIIDFSNERNYKQMNNKKWIRDYVTTHNIRIIHTHTPRTIFFVASSNIHDIIHVSTRHLLTSPGDRSWGLIYTLWDRFSLYVPNHVIAVSKAMYDQIISLPGMNSTRVTMIQNAIPVAQYYVPEQRESYRSELCLSPEALVVGYAGRIQKVKRIDLLLLGFSAVLARFPQARLIIAGEGDLKREMQNYAATLGITEAVVWLGFCREIPGFLAAVDVYVQPSSNEGFSLSVLEAMAAGKPVIATDVGGTNELLINGKTGLLIRPGFSSAIANAICYLLEHPDKRDSLGRAARHHVVEDFNIQSMIVAYRSIYQKYYH